MNRFAQLLDRLAYEPSRNAKLRLLTEYFRIVPDPDRGYALAAITGALSFRHAKAGMIRALITERADEVLFALSYDYVGDLSETVALMWPVVSPLNGQDGAIPPHVPPRSDRGAIRERHVEADQVGLTARGAHGRQHVARLRGCAARAFQMPGGQSSGCGS